MPAIFRIHPAIGIARVGNSPNSFYIAPEVTGGLPIDCDPEGNPIVKDDREQPVSKFKDAQGRIRRQAARFRVYLYDDANAYGSRAEDWRCHRHRRQEVRPASSGSDRRHKMDRLPRQQERPPANMAMPPVIRCAMPASPTPRSGRSLSSIPVRAPCCSRTRSSAPLRLHRQPTALPRHSRRT